MFPVGVEQDEHLGANLRPIAIILAAGGSTRMGRPKALLPVGGVPLICLHEAALGAHCDELRVVLGAGADQIGAVLGPRPRRILNPSWARTGPAESLLLALEGLPDEAQVVVTPVDVPPVSPALLSRLIEAGHVPAALGHLGQAGHPVLVGVGAARAGLQAGGTLREVMGAAPHLVEAGDPVVLLNLNTPGEWEAWLDGAPPDELETWEPSQGGRSFVDSADEPVETSTPTASGPRYEIGGLLGRGGMGIVRAALDRALGREVAFKELDPDLAQDPRAIARLDREAAITGRLDHPGIVAVHDAGRLPDGRPFYTMRLVRGQTLARALAGAPSAEARRDTLRHLLAAAEAVAAAHAAGIVHRDLKPANILIGAHGETQVVDWGLAAPSEAAAAAWAGLPGGGRGGEVVGTPAYMSPEQARGERPAPTDDVWSLGAILYEILVGLPPGREARLPSSELPAELGAIVARAMDLDPARRYPEAEALAADLLAWFEGRRVSAHAYRPIELLRRLYSAWRIPLIIGLAGALAVSLAIAVGWWRTATALDRALAAEGEAQAARGEAERQLARSWVDDAVAAVALDDRARAEQLAVRALTLGEDPRARGVLAAFGVASRPRLLDRAPGPSCDWSAFSPDGSWLLCGAEGQVSRWEGGAPVWTREKSAAGGQVDARGEIRIWDRAGTERHLDLSTGDLLVEATATGGEWVPVQPPLFVWVDGTRWPPASIEPSGCIGRILDVQPSPDSARLAAFCTDGTLLLGTPAHPVQRRIPTALQQDQVPVSFAWVGEDRLLVGSLRGQLSLFDARTGALLRSAGTLLGAIGRLRISPDGRIAAVSGVQGGIGLWELETGSWLGEIPEGHPRDFLLPGEGRLLVHAAALTTWALPGEGPYKVEATGGLADVALSGDGRLLAYGAGDGSVGVIELASGRPLARALIGGAVVKAVAFAPGEEQLAVASAGSPALSLLDLQTGLLRPLATDRRARRLAWTSPERFVATDMFDGLLALSGGEVERWEQGRLYQDLEREAGGEDLLLLDVDGQISRLPPNGGAPVPLLVVPGARAVAGGGGWLAALIGSEVQLFDRAVQPAGRLEAEGTQLLDLALSPEGARVIASALDGRVFVWDRASGALRASLEGHSERVPAIDLSADGRILATGSWDHGARIWDLSQLDRDPTEILAEIEAAWGQTIAPMGAD